MMSLFNACRSILGRERTAQLAHDMGLKAAIVAAVAEAKKGDNPEAIAALLEYIEQLRQSGSMGGRDAADAS